MYDYIIIGAGVAGLTAAINLTRNNLKVLVIEKNSKPLKKLSVTGSGRCNFFNDDEDLKNYHSSSPSYISKYITRYNLYMYEKFRESIGICERIENGYHYPFDNSAVSVVNLILKECEMLDIKIICNKEVTKIKHDRYFTVNGYTSKNLLITTGSPAYYKESNTEKLLDKLKIKYIDFKPSLCKIKIDESFKEISGLRVKASLKYESNGKIINESKGEVLFKENTLSGICSYDLASNYYKYEKDPYIIINFIYDKDKAELKKILEGRRKRLGLRNVSEIFDSIINYKIVKYILNKINIEDKLWDDLNDDEKKKIYDTFTSFKVKVVGTDDFSGSQTVIGGIPIDKINSRTMEVKDGIYAAGEVIDLDGNCGGYNLTIAFITGLLVGGYNDQNI